MLPWWPKEATLNLASEETPTLAGSSRCRWRNHLVMSGDIISLKVAASVGISTWLGGLAELGFLELLEIVHIEVAVGLEPVLVSFDGKGSNEASTSV